MQHGGIELHEAALEDLRGLSCGCTEDGAIVLKGEGEDGHEMVAIMPFGPGTWIYLYTIQADGYGSYAMASTDEMKECLIAFGGMTIVQGLDAANAMGWATADGRLRDMGE